MPQIHQSLHDTLQHYADAWRAMDRARAEYDRGPCESRQRVWDEASEAYLTLDEQLHRSVLAAFPPLSSLDRNRRPSSP